MQLVACHGPPFPQTLPVRRVAVATAPAAKLAPSLASELAKARADEPLAIAVDLAVELDLAAISAELDRRRVPRRGRAEPVAHALAAVATREQAGVRDLLTRLAARGLVVRWQGMTVADRVLVEAMPAAVRALAARPEVAQMRLLMRGSGSVAGRGATDRAEDAANGAREPAGASASTLEGIGARRAWEQGLHGRGVVVGTIDSGASAAHRQLAPGFRGREDPRGSWHDPGRGAPHPVDRALGHGSGVLSVAVGANLDGIELAVAPEATWIACAAFPEGRFDEWLFSECAEWTLTTGRPDVLLAAWLLPTDADPCDRSLAPIVGAWRTAGILPVFAAGNLRSSRAIVRPPANLAGLAPDGGAALAITGLARDGGLLPGAAVGPNPCSEAHFPSLAAPAIDLTTALPLAQDTYRRAEGTSYAAALTAGAAALLVGRDPEAPVPVLEAALRRGAADLGPPGVDDRFGHGRLDVTGALAALADLRRGFPSLYGASPGAGAQEVTASSPSTAR